MSGPIDAHSQNNNVNQLDDDIIKLLAEAEERLRDNSIKPADDSIAAFQVQHTLPHIPKISSGSSLKPYLDHQNDLAVIDTARIIDPVLRTSSQSAAIERTVPRTISKKEKPTAGSDWFDLPKTELTPELKRDLQLLRMRSILDPKRHYKKESGKAQPPKYSQVGTIIEGPTEFFSGRIVKRDRKKTFVEEALALEQSTKRFESRYNDVQDKKKSGKKAFYNSLRAKRKGGKSRR
ncbi:Fcf2 pre-rRNA processing-domain-containing protein [Aspergillus pseudodeflectus]|uniref:Fcf2 pre-rRNA processing-domain-containing protein n=1 Tax=Aspergillus pseudodeflectus TaxID=176178 RepID=A0ABR4JBT7_9EURO